MGRQARGERHTERENGVKGNCQIAKKSSGKYEGGGGGGLSLVSGIKAGNLAGSHIQGTATYRRFNPFI
jgi:hypothetical protein